MSPIGQNIVIPKTNRFSEKRPDHNQQSRGQHNFLYYQPKPYLHNHIQQYRCDIIIQQSSYKDNYDRDKRVAHGIIHGGMPPPGKQATPIIPLENYYYSIKNLPTDSSSTFLGKGTIRMKKLSSLSELQ